MDRSRDDSVARADVLDLVVFGVPLRIRFVGVSPELVSTLRGLWRRSSAVPTRDVAAPEDSGSEDSAPEDSASDLLHLVACHDAHSLLAHGIPADGPPDPPIAVLSSDPVEAPYDLSRAITLQAIGRRRGVALMFHAVGLSGPDGATVALVAPSGTGKTTAASVLGRGLGYVTDETVVVEADHSIAPYPKPLSIITNDAVGHRKEESSADDLGLGPTPPHPRLVATVVLRRDPDVPAPELSMMPLIDGILAVIPETSALPSLPQPLARLCRALCLSGGPFLLRYAEIEDCAAEVTALTAPNVDRDDAAPAWEHVPGSVRDRPANWWGTVSWTSVLTRTTWDDAVVCDGESVILHDLIPSRLSRLGTALWVGADEPSTVADLHDQIVTVIGAHPYSEGLVLDALQVLVDAEVLQIVADPEQTPVPCAQASAQPSTVAGTTLADAVLSGRAGDERFH